MRIEFDEDAFKEYQSWMTKGTIPMLRRINTLIENCQRTPFEGIGKPEPLRGDLSSAWSRRIDQEHRLVYTVRTANDGVQVLVILGCRGHYR